MRNALMIAGLFAAIVLGLAVFAYLRTPSAPSPEDAEARRITDTCAMGTTDSGKSALAVALAPRLRTLNAQATISSAHVGAIIDTIRDDVSGARIYDLYRRCIKDQTILSLIARGIRVDSAAGARGISVSQPPSPAKAAQADQRQPAPANGTCNYNTTKGSLSPVICSARDVNIKVN